jgi:hypothetical protein
VQCATGGNGEAKDDGDVYVLAMARMRGTRDDGGAVTFVGQPRSVNSVWRGRWWQRGLSKERSIEEEERAERLRALTAEAAGEGQVLGLAVEQQSQHESLNESVEHRRQTRR